jgi:alpha-D-xyloside xylohydrolase
MRPMVLEFPEDPAGYAFDLQYCLGRELLVSPVVNADGWVTTYLPQGHWLDWWSGATVEGPTTLRRQVPLPEMPLYLRENSLLPLGPERSHVGERPADPLTVEVFVTAQAEFSLRSDAGQVILRCRRQDGRIVFEASDVPCAFILRVHQCETPTGVRADGTDIARVELQGLVEIEAGWALDREIVVVKARARRIEIE